MRTIIAELALVAMVIMGVGLAYSVFSSSTSAVTKADLWATVKPVYTSQGTYLDISLKNTGGHPATIQHVYIDDTEVTQSLGWGNTTLQPGGSLENTVPAPSGFGSGQHIIKIVYGEGGVTKTVSYQFSA